MTDYKDNFQMLKTTFTINNLKLKDIKKQFHITHCFFNLT